MRLSFYREIVNLLSASKWLELAAEVRELANEAEAPDVRSALSELALAYTAQAAGLDALEESGGVPGSIHGTGDVVSRQLNLKAVAYELASIARSTTDAIAAERLMEVVDLMLRQAGLGEVRVARGEEAEGER